MNGTVTKVIGVGQLILAFIAGLGALGIIHIDTGWLTALIGGGLAGGGVNKIQNPDHD